MGSFLQDVRFGIRNLRGSAVLTTVAVITLALGIGANTAIFSMVDAILLRPLPFHESGQLVRTSVLSLIFDNNLREIRMVQKSLQLPNGTFLPIVATVEGRRIFSEDD